MYGPFCGSSAAVVATAIGEGQCPCSPTNLRNMTDTDYNSPWLKPISTTVSPDLWNTTNSYIADGTNTTMDIIMGDVEGTYNDSHTNNVNTAAGHLHLQRHYDNFNMLHTQPRSGSQNLKIGQYNIPENWEEINIQIRQRNEPPKLAHSAKFTRSSITIASQNINGRDKNKSINNSGHKFTYLKKMVDEN